eukprot:TRINITY_DN2076_c0_g1_i2.p1 TRINITY_DN2076_c0_g1~~TRINITY_DN2076_c0_g1_i2.p1  ORF type:complete len:106 (-),score=24.65 TRINITY_DN2076_c0_g1_i2:68-385(-)
MLAYSGEEDMNTNNMTSAIISNIWQNFQNKDSSLKVMLFYNEDGAVAVTKIDVLLLCCLGEENTDVGQLKLKTLKIASYLTPPITSVLENLQKEELLQQKKTQRN